MNYFQGLPHDLVKTKIANKCTLELPEQGSPIVRRIIERCWVYEPCGRPNFNEILDYLEKVSWFYI